MGDIGESVTSIGFWPWSTFTGIPKPLSIDALTDTVLGDFEVNANIFPETAVGHDDNIDEEEDIDDSTPTGTDLGIELCEPCDSLSWDSDWTGNFGILDDTETFEDTFTLGLEELEDDGLEVTETIVDEWFIGIDGTEVFEEDVATVMVTSEDTEEFFDDLVEALANNGVPFPVEFNEVAEDVDKLDDMDGSSEVLFTKNEAEVDDGVVEVDVADEFEAIDIDTLSFIPGESEGTETNRITNCYKEFLALDQMSQTL